MKLIELWCVLSCVDVKVFRSHEHNTVYLLDGFTSDLDVSEYADCVVRFCFNHFDKFMICIE